MHLLRKLGRHTLSNLVAYVALFVALGGTAYASVIITANNQVASNTISGHHPPAGDHSNLISASVNARDLANGAVTGAKLGANSVDGSKVVDGSLTGADVQSNSLTGSQINVGTLGEVPAAKVGGFGRSTGGGSCSPAGNSYNDCVILTVDLPAQSRVLMIGSVDAEANVDGSQGECKLVTQFGDVAGTQQLYYGANQYDTDGGAISGVTGVLGPGSVDFGVDCNNEVGAMTYFDVNLTVVALSPD